MSTAPAAGWTDRNVAWARRHAVVLVIGALSTVLHLVALGRRPLAHDEAIDAWFSWQARHLGVMEYDPVYHGPLRFYLEGLVLNIGTSAFWARLVAALAGVATTVVIASSTKLLGRFGAPAAAVLFMISPTALTVTRTGREDSLTALVSVGLLLLVARLLTEPRGRDVIGAGILLALSFGLKETTFLFGLCAFVFVVGALLVAWRYPDGQSRAALRRQIGLGRQPWIWMAIAFLLVFIVIYTSAFRYPEGFVSGLVDGVKYWWSQHDVRRGGQPWFFYLVVYAGYEWLLLLVAAVGVIVTLGRRRIQHVWWLTMAVGQVIVYSWAGEKFAWLALHPLLPMFLLAGVGAQSVYVRSRGASWRPFAAVASGALAVMTLVVAIRPAITHGADPRELLVTVQSSEEVRDIAADLRAGVENGSIESILIDGTGGASWPWVWYLHDLPVAYLDVDPLAIPDDYDAMVIVGLSEELSVPPGYSIERFPFRVWWVPDYANIGIGDWFRWFVSRDTWSPTGSLDSYLLLRSPITQAD